MKEVKVTEYRIPICEFGEKFDITKPIESVSYYKGSKCLKEKGEDDDDYVTVEVAVEV